MMFSQNFLKVPWPLKGDAYTVAGSKLASSAANQKSVYNFTNRYSPTVNMGNVAKDSRMLLYGLTDFIRNHLTTPVTIEDVELSKQFMEDAHSFGGPLPFNEEMWMRVVNEYNGFLPIKIEAIPEATTFFPHEPAIQVTSLDEGFGEIAAMVEAVLLGMVSIASARLTLTRHWLERVREYVGKDMRVTDKAVIDTYARFFIHDFGMRASSCAEESEMLGRAHLLVFHGTDTFNAAFQAWMMNAARPTGTSIPALAHRIVQGYEHEEDAYKNLHSVDGAAASYVADCYNFENAVRTHLVELAKAGEKVVVAREDSGDMLENDMLIINTAIKHGLVNSDWTPTTLKCINGNSINPEKMEKVLNNRWDNGLNATSWGIFGVGGYLRNTPTRDTLSSAYKLSAVGNEMRPVCKLAEESGKMSVPGPNKIVRTYNSQTVYFADEHVVNGIPMYEVYYDGSKNGMNKFGRECDAPFDVLQSRAIHDFDDAADWIRDSPEEILSEKIINFREETFKKYRTE